MSSRPMPNKVDPRRVQVIERRGLRLIRQLADQRHWLSDGRGAVVEFRWST